MLAEALERGRGVDIGLLQLDAPIAELIERDGAAGDGAAHEVAGRQHLHLAVEIFELGFALEAEIAFEAVHQGECSPLSNCVRHNSVKPRATVRQSRLRAKCPACHRARALRFGLAAASRSRTSACAPTWPSANSMSRRRARRHLGGAPQHRALGVAHQSEAAREHIVVAEGSEQLGLAVEPARDRATNMAVTALPLERSRRASRSRPAGAARATTCGLSRVAARSSQVRWARALARARASAVALALSKRWRGRSRMLALRGRPRVAARKRPRCASSAAAQDARGA